MTFGCLEFDSLSMEFVDDQKSKTHRVDLFKANSKMREEAKQEEEE